MSRSLPHLTLTTSTSSLSPTSPILQLSSPTHPSLLSHDPYIHCEDSRRSCGSSDLQSPTGYEPQRIELDRNFEVEHQDLTQDRIMRDDYRSPITEDMDDFGKIGVESLSYDQISMFLNVFSVRQKQLQGVPPVTAQTSELEGVVSAGRWRGSGNMPCTFCSVFFFLCS